MLSLLECSRRLNITARKPPQALSMSVDSMGYDELYELFGGRGGVPGIPTHQLKRLPAHAFHGPAAHSLSTQVDSARCRSRVRSLLPPS